MANPLVRRICTDGQPPRSAFVQSMWILDQTQSLAECEEVYAYLETHLALVDPSDPAHWTVLGQREGARHDAGGTN